MAKPANTLRPLAQISEDLDEVERSYEEWLAPSLRRLLGDLKQMLMIRMGEDESDQVDPEITPTPGQWLFRFNRAVPITRIEWIERLLRSDHLARMCESENHQGLSRENYTLRNQLARLAPPGSKRDTINSVKLKIVWDYAKALLDSDSPTKRSVGIELARVLGNG